MHQHNQVRIATTPTPFIYRHLAVIMAFTFVFTFPLGFVATLKSAVIPCTAAICTSGRLRLCARAMLLHAHD